MRPAMSTVPEKVPARAWVASVVATLAAAATSIVLQWSWRDELPDRIATHWSGEEPDGFMSLTGNMTFTVVFVVCGTAFLLLVGAAVRQVREMGALAAGMAAWISTLTALIVNAQRGLSDAESAPFGGEGLFISLAVGLAVGGLVWLVVRRRGQEPVADQAPEPGAPVIEGADGQRLAWTRHVRFSRTLTGFVLAATILGALFAAATGYGTSDWWAGAFILLVDCVILIPLALNWAVVTIDHRGVQARALGIRWVNIPLETITSAERQERAVPLGEFGGWGLRSGFAGDRGLVTGEGEALRIHRAGQCDWVITIDDAARAAAVVNTLVAQRRGA